MFRRFEEKGYYNDVLIIDDYAHHPSEVKACLKGARDSFENRIVCLFQPHTFTRTKDQYLDFAKSFDDADILIVTDIYAAREKPIEGITGKLISDSAVQFGHKNVEYIENYNDIESHLKNVLQKGDILITMGAGNIWQIGENLVKQNGVN